MKDHNKSGQKITLINDSVIYYGGLKPAGGTGAAIDRIKSMDLGAFAIDEASEIPKDFFLVLCSRIKRGLLEKIIKTNPSCNKTNPLYKGLLTSNPEPGWVRQYFVDNKYPDHTFIPSLPSDNPHLSADYVEGLKQKYPPEWITKYLNGDWDAYEGDNFVFPYYKIKESIDRELELDCEEVEYGLDVAEFGGDTTVLFKRTGGKAELCFNHPKSDLMETVGWVQAVMRDDGCLDAPIKVDSIGIGAGVASRLEEEGRNVTRIVGAEKAEEREDGMAFFNKRAQMYYELREDMLNDRISLEDNPELVAQLSCIKYGYRSDRALEVESKTSLRKRGIKSPNLADALVYAFAKSETRDMVRWL